MQKQIPISMLSLKKILRYKLSKLFKKTIHLSKILMIVRN